MTELLTAAQMRAIEQAAIASGEVTGLELMERAGRGVVAAIFARWPALAKGGHRAVVLCGPGNNGGDGFVVARLLHDAGWDIEVFLLGDGEALPPDAKTNYVRWCAVGGVTPLTEHAFRHGRFEGVFADIYVDALFGTGLSRAVAGELASFLRHLNGYGGDDYRARMVSVDVPSGLCADSGRVLTPHPQASIPAAVLSRLTVTFDSPKLGHFLQDGPQHCGQIVVKDIGLQHHRETRQSTHAGRGATTRFPHAGLILNERMVPDARPFFAIDPSALAKADGHKYSHGHALVLSGGVGKGGAARLAARGALRVGAGAVTIACPPAALIENAAQLNAIMLRAVKGVAGLNDVFSDHRINALCMGPGMGVSDESRGLIEAGLKSGRAIVLDADALTLIGRDAPLFASVHENCVLTPHAGEFARLFPDLAEKLAAPATNGPAYSKVDATREAAKRAGCTVLYKGPDTVIADPSGRCSINASVYDRSAPWLATAGSGDVLAGFITGLLARGWAPLQAAETGAWLHTESALSFGPGLIAEDLPEELPKLFRALGI
ncbi:NAD(P)H-hydrate dehydratase [Yoonia sp.]|uniref:NAD(P)H-hydrate dehydratase n=1 Tax=Yoonia sp. TaxID=2212373 RepID=UPI00358DDBE5